MTSVRQAAQTGTGVIGASFREIPTIALPAAQNIIKKLDQIGLGGVLMMGKPNQPLLDIPVRSGRVGIIVAGGLNPIAALEETGIATQSSALHSLCDFAQLSAIDEI
jgi:repressor of nif and glnA expression